MATTLKERAATVIEKSGDLLQVHSDHQDPKGMFTAQPLPKDAKTLAEERLREMMRQVGTPAPDQNQSDGKGKVHATVPSKGEEKGEK